MSDGVNKDKLLGFIPRLAGRRIVVVGDVFLDEYIIGRATRLSREAPIPVLEFEGRRWVPGGAANPAHNVVALDGVAQQVGVVGQDREGEQLLAQLREAGIGTEGVVTDLSRPTTTKTRIVAQGSLRFPQQLARIDRLDRRPIDALVEEGVIAHLEALIPEADALLISDYRTGLVGPAVVEAGLRLARRHGKWATVDSQGDLAKYRGFDLIKCNHHEAAAALGSGPVRSPVPTWSEEDYQKALEHFLIELEAGVVLITRGAEGMSLLGQGDLHTPYYHIPAANRSDVFDVTGAGDTVIAVVTLALTAGASPSEAAHLANYAAGLVVRKLGNATASPEELAWAIKHW